MEITVKKAAKKLKVTRQAIFNAIQNKRVKGIKRKIPECKKAIWFISQEELKRYTKSRRDRAYAVYNGELIFDKSKGLHSVKETANILGCSLSYIYSCVNKDVLKAHRKGCAWVIHIDDIKRFKQNEFTKKRRVRIYEKEGNFRALISES